MVIYGKDIKPLKDSRLATLLSGGTSHVRISANKFHEIYYYALNIDGNQQMLGNTKTYKHVRQSQG